MENMENTKKNDVHWSKGINSLQDYEELASRTAMYRGIGTFSGFIYNVLKLNGEAGEIADKVGKIYGKFGESPELSEECKLDLAYELSDTLWHLTKACNDLGYSLAEIAAMNIDKLDSRHRRGVIEGNGDDR